MLILCTDERRECKLETLVVIGVNEESPRGGGGRHELGVIEVVVGEAILGG